MAQPFNAWLGVNQPDPEEAKLAAMLAQSSVQRDPAGQAPVPATPDEGNAPAPGGVDPATILQYVKDQNTNRDTRTKGAKTNKLLPQQDYDAFLNRINTQQIKALKDQETGISQSEAGLNDLRSMPQQVDMLPLARLVDQWTGSQLAKGRKPAEDPEMRQERLFKLQDTLQKERGAMSTNQLSNMRAQLQSYQQDQVIKMLGGQATGQNYLRGGGKKDEDLNREIERCQKNMGDQVPTLLDKVSKITPIINSGKDIGGVGVGKSLLPEFMLSDEGSHVRQLATGLYRSAVYMDSGKQINDNEAKDEMKQLGINLWSSQRAFKTGLQDLVDRVHGIVRGKEAGYRPEAVQTYYDRLKSRGGKLPGDVFGAYGAGGVQAGPAAPDALKKPPKDWTPEDKKAIDAYEKALGG